MPRDNEGCLSVSLWHLGESLDVPDGVLSQLAASLELEDGMGFLQGEIPRCASYHYHLSPRFLLADKTEPAELMLCAGQSTKEKRTFVRPKYVCARSRHRSSSKTSPEWAECPWVRSSRRWPHGGSRPHPQGALSTSNAR